MTSTLSQKANQFRKEILSMIYKSKSGHLGGSFSLIDFLTVLYFGKDNKNTTFFNTDTDANADTNDYLILSKAHCAPALYSVLGEIGYIDKKEFDTLRQVNNLLQGHATNKIPGVKISGGSLGQGLSAGNGIALGLRTNNKDNKIWVLMGDGEIQEGQVWEAAMTTAHYKLNNVRALIDKNNIQIDGTTKDIMNVNSIEEKFKSFGWEIISIDDGNNIEQLIKTLNQVNSYSGEKPLAIISNTIKGKGVSFMEDTNAWHGKAPSDEEYKKAMGELNI